MELAIAPIARQQLDSDISAYARLVIWLIDKGSASTEKHQRRSEPVVPLRPTGYSLLPTAVRAHATAMVSY